MRQGAFLNISFGSQPVSATFGPRPMFKHQLLSFHVASKTFITQNNLFCHSQQHPLLFLTLSILFCTL